MYDLHAQTNYPHLPGCRSAIRGFIWRRRIKRESDKELMFIGMKPKVGRGGRRVQPQGARCSG